MSLDTHELIMMKRYSYKYKNIKLLDYNYCVMRYDIGRTKIYSLFCQDFGDRVLLAKTHNSSYGWVATCDYIVKVDNYSSYWKKMINFEFMKSRGGYDEQDEIIKHIL